MLVPDDVVLDDPIGDAMRASQDVMSQKARAVMARYAAGSSTKKNNSTLRYEAPYSSVEQSVEAFGTGPSLREDLVPQVQRESKVRSVSAVRAARESQLPITFGGQIGAAEEEEECHHMPYPPPVMAEAEDEKLAAANDKREDELVDAGVEHECPEGAQLPPLAALWSIQCEDVHDDPRAFCVSLQRSHEGLPRDGTVLRAHHAVHRACGAGEV